MKILMLAQFFPPQVGGEERHVLNLSHELARRGHTVSVATQLVAGATPREVLDSGVTVHRLTSSAMRLARWYSDANRPHHPPIPDPSLTRQLSRLIQRERPDVVHAHNWIINSAVALRRGRAGHRRFGLVLTLHDYSNVCATKRLMRAGLPCSGAHLRHCLPCARSHYGPLIGLVTASAVPVMRRWKDRALDHIVSVSTAVAEGNRVADTAVPSSVIPNFVPDSLIERRHRNTDTRHSRDLLSSSGRGDLSGRDGRGNGGGDLSGEEEVPEGGFLLFVGDLTRDKGVPVLLDAYRSLGPQRPPLLMVGRRGPDTPTDGGTGVRIVEQWPHDTIMLAFRRCLLAVLPSTWPDPCPTTVLEAMASQRCVITTRTGGMVDMVEDGVSGVLVTPGDASELAKAIQGLLDDPDRRARLAAAARNRVGDFTASSVAGRIEEIYRKVIAR